MTENEFLLADRIAKIQSVINRYGENNFYISFSGGKDSLVVHCLVDMAIPGNKIPRVYADTGIDYKLLRDFVKEWCDKDDRFVMIKPVKSIRKTLENEGFPVKSKEFSEYHFIGVNTHFKGKTAMRYLYPAPEHARYGCPKILRDVFSEDWHGFKISDKCCQRMKEDPLHKWQRENNKPYGILGIMRAEGGRRNDAVCLAFKDKNKTKLRHFSPLAPVSHEWEQWFIEEYNIKLCPLYYPPYNFDRTGCKGCPLSLTVQRDLDIMAEFFPNERKQCEYIWKEVYDLYRSKNYRLRPLTEEEKEKFLPKKKETDNEHRKGKD